jgi:hypothetical protein
MKRGRPPKDIYKTSYGEPVRTRTRKERVWQRAGEDLGSIRSDKYGKRLDELSRSQLTQIERDHRVDPDNPYYNPGGITARSAGTTQDLWELLHKEDFDKGRSPESRKIRRERVVERDDELRRQAEQLYLEQPTLPLKAVAAKLGKLARFAKLSNKTIEKKIRGVKRDARKIRLLNQQKRTR